ncbi:hypothetical protein AOLI_G00119000 [Acnodon oligacanthus]
MTSAASVTHYSESLHHLITLPGLVIVVVKTENRPPAGSAPPGEREAAGSGRLAVRSWEAESMPLTCAELLASSLARPQETRRDNGGREKRHHRYTDFNSTSRSPHTGFFTDVRHTAALSPSDSTKRIVSNLQRTNY